MRRVRMPRAVKASRTAARRRALASLKDISPAEDAAITKAARSDPDARPLTDAFIKRKPLSQAQVAEIAKAFRRGRGATKRRDWIEIEGVS